MNSTPELIRRLETCPAGSPGWRAFEDVCIEILEHLFVPPLAEPKIQARTLSGTERRDAVFPNRNSISDNNWGEIYRELDARLVLFEFKNYGSEDIGGEEVNQIGTYLRKQMGRLGILCCNKRPVQSAYIRRNTFLSEQKKIILFITKKELKEMLYRKERAEDPSDVIIDLLEWFYLEHE